MEIKNERLVNIVIGFTIGIFTILFFNLFTSTLLILFIILVMVLLERNIQRCEKENEEYEVNEDDPR